MDYLPMPKNKPKINEDKIRFTKHRSLPELYLQAVDCEHDDDGSSNLSAPGPPHDPKIQGKRFTIDGGQKGAPYKESTKDCTHSGISPPERPQGASPAVATATLPALHLDPSPKHFHLPLRHYQKEALDSLISGCRDPLFDSTVLSSTSSQPSSVDRSNSWSSSMTVLKPSRSLKASRRNLAVGLNHIDTKKSSLNIDNDDHDIFKEIITDNPYDESRGTVSKRFSPLPPTLRTIRRRKRLSIGRPSSNPEENAVKPIAISLTFSSSAVPQFPSKKVSLSALCDRVTYSAEMDSDSKATFDPPSSPKPADNPTQVHVHESSEKRASASLSTRPSTPLSISTSFHPSGPANVRLGHPSRPYYSAIRKQGISPPSSRRSSIKDPAGSPTRPKSYSSPPPLPASKITPGSSPQRHLSLSAVTPTSSVISAFSLDDVLDDNVDEELPAIPLTPPPVSGRMSFGSSLASVAKSLTRKRSMSGPSTVSTIISTNRKHSHSASAPQALFPLSAGHPSLQPNHGNMKGFFRMSTPAAGSGASGIGFSVSGETELKMALAFSEAQTTKNNTDSNIGASFVPATTPAIQEEEDVGPITTELPPTLLSTPLSPSPISPPSSLQLPTVSSTNSRNGIAGRVKKLTQGLKDMLLMTTGNNNTNSTTTTTTNLASQS